MPDSQGAHDQKAYVQSQVAKSTPPPAPPSTTNSTTGSVGASSSGGPPKTSPTVPSSNPPTLAYDPTQPANSAHNRAVLAQQTVDENKAAGTKQDTQLAESAKAASNVYTPPSAQDIAQKNFTDSYQLALISAAKTDNPDAYMANWAKVNYGINNLNKVLSGQTDDPDKQAVQQLQDSFKGALVSASKASSTQEKIAYLDNWSRNYGYQNYNDFKTQTGFNDSGGRSLGITLTESVGASDTSKAEKTTPIVSLDTVIATINSKGLVAFIPQNQIDKMAARISMPSTSSKNSMPAPTLAGLPRLSQQDIEQLQTIQNTVNKNITTNDSAIVNIQKALPDLQQQLQKASAFLNSKVSQSPYVTASDFPEEYGIVRSIQNRISAMQSELQQRQQNTKDYHQQLNDVSQLITGYQMVREKQQATVNTAMSKQQQALAQEGLKEYQSIHGTGATPTKGIVADYISGVAAFADTDIAKKIQEIYNKQYESNRKLAATSLPAINPFAINAVTPSVAKASSTNENEYFGAPNKGVIISVPSKEELSKKYPFIDDEAYGQLKRIVSDVNNSPIQSFTLVDENRNALGTISKSDSFVNDLLAAEAKARTQNIYSIGLIGQMKESKTVIQNPRIGDVETAQIQKTIADAKQKGITNLIVTGTNSGYPVRINIPVNDRTFDQLKTLLESAPNVQFDIHGASATGKGSQATEYSGYTMPSPLLAVNPWTKSPEEVKRTLEGLQYAKAVLPPKLNTLMLTAKTPEQTLPSVLTPIDQARESAVGFATPFINLGKAIGSVGFAANAGFGMNLKYEEPKELANQPTWSGLLINLLGSKANIIPKNQQVTWEDLQKEMQARPAYYIGTEAGDIAMFGAPTFIAKGITAAKDALALSRIKQIVETHLPDIVKEQSAGQAIVSTQNKIAEIQGKISSLDVQIQNKVATPMSERILGTSDLTRSKLLKEIQPTIDQRTALQADLQLLNKHISELRGIQFTKGSEAIVGTTKTPVVEDIQKIGSNVFGIHFKPNEESPILGAIVRIGKEDSTVIPLVKTAPESLPITRNYEMLEQARNYVAKELGKGKTLADITSMFYEKFTPEKVGEFYEVTHPTADQELAIMKIANVDERANRIVEMLIPPPSRIAYGFEVPASSLWKINELNKFGLSKMMIGEASPEYLQKISSGNIEFMRMNLGQIAKETELAPTEAKTFASGIGLKEGGEQTWFDYLAKKFPHTDFVNFLGFGKKVAPYEAPEMVGENLNPSNVARANKFAEMTQEEKDAKIINQMMAEPEKPLSKKELDALMRVTGSRYLAEPSKIGPDTIKWIGTGLIGGYDAFGKVKTNYSKVTVIPSGAGGKGKYKTNLSAGQRSDYLGSIESKVEKEMAEYRKKYRQQLEEYLIFNQRPNQSTTQKQTTATEQKQINKGGLKSINDFLNDLLTGQQTKDKNKKGILPLWEFTTGLKQSTAVTPKTELASSLVTTQTTKTEQQQQLDQQLQYKQLQRLLERSFSLEDWFKTKPTTEFQPPIGGGARPYLPDNEPPKRNKWWQSVEQLWGVGDLPLEYLPFEVATGEQNIKKVVAKYKLDWYG